MYGDMHDLGLVPRAAAELLGCSGGLPVNVSMVELHNDTLSDLFLPRGTWPAPQLEVRGYSDRAMATIEGIREMTAHNLPDLLGALRCGLSKRQVAATNVNL